MEAPPFPGVVPADFSRSLTVLMNPLQGSGLGLQEKCKCIEPCFATALDHALMIKLSHQYNGTITTARFQA